MTPQIVLPYYNPLTAQLDIGGVWHMTYFFGLALILVNWIAVFFRRLLNLPEKLLLAYTLLYALFISEFPKLHFGLYNTAFQATAGQVFAEIILVVIGAMSLQKWARKILPFVVLFSLACVWLPFNGLMIAPSFNSAFAALAMPLSPWWVIALTLLTIVTHHGSTAVLIAAAQFLALAIKFRKLRKWGLAALGILGAAAYFNSGHMFDGWDRLNRYQQFFNLWRQDWRNIIFGVGPGTFAWSSLEADKYAGDPFLQLHSDWLGFGWDFGLIGLGLAGAVFITAVRNAWEKPWLLSALFGCGAFALTYHPLRFFPTAFLTAMIVFQARRDDQL